MAAFQSAAGGDGGAVGAHNADGGDGLSCLRHRRGALRAVYVALPANRGRTQRSEGGLRAGGGQQCLLGV